MSANTEPLTPADQVELFDPPPARRRLAAGDALRLLVALVVLLIGVLLGTIATDTIDGVESDLVDGVARLPDRVEELTIGTAQLVATFVPLGVLLVGLWRRRWRLLLELWLVWIVTGLATAALLDWLGERGVVEEIQRRTTDTDASLLAAEFPTTSYLASAVAAATVGATYVPRRWRRAIWTWIVVLVVLRLLGPGQPPLDVWIGCALGVVLGSVALLLVGSPNAEPEPAVLLAGLRRAGLDPVAVRRRDRDDGGPTYETDERDGDRTFIKLRTPDDRSWDLLSRAYRAVRLRSSEVSRPYSTLKRRIEHEALALHTARAAGARCPRPIAVGITTGDAAFLVEEWVDGRRMSELAPGELDDDVVRAALEQVAHLHAVRVAHHDLTLGNLLVDDDGRVWIADLDSAELAASRRRLARDTAEVLVAFGLVVGPERVVAAAVDVLGQDAVSASLPLLQPLALSRTLGRSIRDQKDLLDRLRAEIHGLTGAEDVPLERLARVQPRTLVMILAAGLAINSLLPQFGNLGDTVDAFGSARWEWLPLVLLFAVSYFGFATISFLGSVAQPLPLTASARSQVATSFAQLVGPASAGKAALAGRFLQRNGLTTAEASASVALNMVAGLVTHLALMVGFFAWAGGAQIGGVSLPSLGTLLLVGVGAVVVLAIGWAIRPVRERLLRPIVDGLRMAVEYVGDVVRSPIRVLALLGGSTCITLSYLFAAVAAVNAFDGDLSVAQIGAAYLGAAAIANIAPTPGGLGALEASMIAALTGFGLDGAIAISAVLTFRLATFWLPIFPGWLTFLWMERRDEI